MGAENPEFIVPVPEPPAHGLPAAGSVILDELPLVADRRSLDARRPRHAALGTPARRIQRPSLRPDAAPISGYRLEYRQGGKRSGLGAQHPRAEPDAANNGEFAESVKLRVGKPALGTDENRSPRIRGKRQ